MEHWGVYCYKPYLSTEESIYHYKTVSKWLSYLWDWLLKDVPSLIKSIQLTKLSVKLKTERPTFSLQNIIQLTEMSVRLKTEESTFIYKILPDWLNYLLDWSPHSTSLCYRLLLLYQQEQTATETYAGNEVRDTASERSLFAACFYQPFIHTHTITTTGIEIWFQNAYHALILLW